MEGTVNDSDKLDDLRKKISNYAKTIEHLQSKIKTAKIRVGEKWKDYKYKDFNEAYAPYEKDIEKFQEVLEVVVTKTLPLKIQELRDIEKINVKSS